MLNRFDDECKRAFGDAREKALRLGHGFLDAEHIVLGLLANPDSIAVRMLRELSIDPSALQVRMEGRLARSAGGSATKRQLPFTERSKRLLELMLEEAGSMGEEGIGTGHMLLACARLPEGPLQHEGSTEPLGVEDVRRVLDAIRDGSAASRSSSPPEPTPAARLRQAATLCTDVTAILMAERAFLQLQLLRELVTELVNLADELDRRASRRP
ncbi:MAG: hypothetical protein HOP15_09840 [Planctomycetes bacterium]|nr:hypothetical protein [Planctomycetota bacterium]